MSSALECPDTVLFDHFQSPIESETSQAILINTFSKPLHILSMNEPHDSYYKGFFNVLISTFSSLRDNFFSSKDNSINFHYKL